MREKILWIAFGTTMAFWLGCAGRGGEQNYKVLEEDRPILQPDRPSGAPMSRATIPSLWGPANATAAALESAAPSAPQAPSANILDRSNWPVIPVAPASGETHHGPVYFETYYFGQPRRAIDRTDNPDERLDAALMGAEAENWTVENAKAFFVQPLLFAKDFVLLPYHLILTPPWSDQVTP